MPLPRGELNQTDPRHTPKAGTLTAPGQSNALASIRVPLPTGPSQNCQSTRRFIATAPPSPLARVISISVRNVSDAGWESPRPPRLPVTRPPAGPTDSDKGLAGST